MIDDKRGWIRIVEASIAILFITGVVLVVINSNDLEIDETSRKILNEEVSILREIQLNNSLREDVLSAPFLPVESQEIGFPEAVKSKMDSKTPGYLECVLKICSLEDRCILTTENTKSVYSESVLITTIPESPSYSPRRLKIFCWGK